MKVGGTFNGTGADVYICCGFVPDWVRIWNLEGTQRILLEWNKLMQGCAEVVEGIQLTAADQTAAALTKGNGVLPYYGTGSVLTASDVGTTTYGEGVYLAPDNKDYRYYSDNSPHGAGDAVAVDIDTWTLGSAANYTGNFNEDATGTYIGEGSSIIIDGMSYTIVALTAGQGEAANEVTLSHNVSSGVVEYIGGMYSYAPMTAGQVAMDGFLISNTTVNVNDARMAFEAGKYDR